MTELPIHVFWDRQVDLLTVAVPRNHVSDEGDVLEVHDETDQANPRLMFVTILTRPVEGTGSYAVAAIPVGYAEHRKLWLRLRNLGRPEEPRSRSVSLNGRLNTTNGARMAGLTHWQPVSRDGKIDLHIVDGKAGIIEPDRKGVADDASAFAQKTAAAPRSATIKLSGESYQQDTAPGEYGPVYHVKAMNDSIPVEVVFVGTKDAAGPGVDLVFPGDVTKADIARLRVSLAMVSLERFVARNQGAPLFDALHSKVELNLTPRADGTKYCRLAVDWSKYRPLSRVLIMQSPEALLPAQELPVINVRDIRQPPPDPSNNPRFVFFCRGEGKKQKGNIDWLFAGAYYIDRLLPDHAFAKNFPIPDIAPSAEKMRNAWCETDESFMALVPRNGPFLNYTGISLYAYRYAVKIFEAAAIGTQKSPPSFETFLKAPHLMPIISRMNPRHQAAALQATLASGPKFDNKTDLAKLLVIDAASTWAEASLVDQARWWWDQVVAQKGDLSVVIALACMPQLLKKVVRLGVLPLERDHIEIARHVDDLERKLVRCLEPPFPDPENGGRQESLQPLDVRVASIEDRLSGQYRRCMTVLRTLYAVLGSADAGEAFLNAISLTELVGTLRGTPTERLSDTKEQDIALAEKKFLTLLDHFGIDAPGAETLATAELPDTVADACNEFQSIGEDGKRLGRFFIKVLLALVDCADVASANIAAFGLNLPPILLGQVRAARRTTAHAATATDMRKTLEMQGNLLFVLSDLSGYLPKRTQNQIGPIDDFIAGSQEAMDRN